MPQGGEKGRENHKGRREGQGKGFFKIWVYFLITFLCFLVINSINFSPSWICLAHDGIWWIIFPYPYLKSQAFCFLSPVQLKRGSDTAALVGTRHPGRVREPPWYSQAPPQITAGFNLFPLTNTGFFTRSISGLQVPQLPWTPPLNQYTSSWHIHSICRLSLSSRLYSPQYSKNKENFTSHFATCRDFLYFTTGLQHERKVGTFDITLLLLHSSGWLLVKKTSCLFSNNVTANLSRLTLGNSHHKYTGTCTEPSMTLTKAKQVLPLNLERPQNGPYWVIQNKISAHKGKEERKGKKMKKKEKERREKHLNGILCINCKKRKSINQELCVHLRWFVDITRTRSLWSTTEQSPFQRKAFCNRKSPVCSAFHK